MLPPPPRIAVVVSNRDPLERTAIRNAHLRRLSTELRSYHASGSLDAFGLYAYGVVLKGLDRSPRVGAGAERSRSRRRRFQAPPQGGGEAGVAVTAHAVLIESLVRYPYNWSAWLDLSELCVDDPSIHPGESRFS